MKNWYSGGSSFVKVDGKCSSMSHGVGRGVKQGSILSPVLFLLVMDPLLKKLQDSSLGLSLNSYYAGGYLHADDIRTLSTSSCTLEKQATLVCDFADKNFLKLNVLKCEVIVFGSGNGSVDSPNCVVGGGALPVRDTVKCLGYWWNKDLVALKCVDENIKKARKAFFGYGSLRVFQGSLNPLSSALVIDCCVLPVLLYGAENWILTPVLLDRLERFQGELAKRVLRWPRHHSNTAAVVALGLESVKSRVLGLHEAGVSAEGFGWGCRACEWWSRVKRVCLVYVL